MSVSAIVQIASDMILVAKRLVKERGDVRIAHGIEHLVTRAPRPHQPNAAESREMMRHRRGRNAGQLGQGVDAQLAPGQGEDQECAGGVRKRGEGLGDERGLLGRKMGEAVLGGHGGSVFE